MKWQIPSIKAESTQQTTNPATSAVQTACHKFPEDFGCCCLFSFARSVCTLQSLHSFPAFHQSLRSSSVVSAVRSKIIMICTRTSKDLSAASPESSSGASPGSRDGSLGGDDRSPSPLPRTSRGRMQTPSAAVSRGGSPKHGAEKKSANQITSP